MPEIRNHIQEIDWTRIHTGYEGSAIIRSNLRTYSIRSQEWSKHHWTHENLRNAFGEIADEFCKIANVEPLTVPYRPVRMQP